MNRMTKLECRMTKECRSPNDKVSAMRASTSFGFRHSDLIRHSSFGFRHSSESVLRRINYWLKILLTSHSSSFRPAPVSLLSHQPLPALRHSRGPFPRYVPGHGFVPIALCR